MRIKGKEKTKALYATNCAGQAVVELQDPYFQQILYYAMEQIGGMWKPIGLR